MTQLVAHGGSSEFKSTPAAPSRMQQLDLAQCEASSNHSVEAVVPPTAHALEGVQHTVHISVAADSTRSTPPRAPQAETVQVIVDYCR
jgi:hypothetical protein